MAGIYLLLGSNLGDRQQLLKQARQGITKRIGSIMVQSSFYHTASWEMPGAPDFINQVIRVSTRLNPYALLYHCLTLEIEQGRRQHLAPGQSRHLDIDILYYNQLSMTSDLLTLPHPRIAARRFVLQPMAEIAPNHLHPVLNKTQTELLHQCSDTSLVQKIKI